MSRALVLAGGGIAGIGWEAGLVTGLRAAGVDLGEADLVVGTSAGSVVGAMVAQGADLATEIAAVAEAEAAAAHAQQIDMEKVMQAFALMYGDEGIEPQEARRRIGELALTVEGDGARLAQIGERLSSHAWPDRELLVTAVDTADGAFQIWKAASGVPLPLAVASSCAVPAVFPPVEIAGRRYMDGGVRSVSNADLAAGHDKVVIVEPMAHMTPRPVLAREIAALGDAKIAAVGPNQPAIELFGVDILDARLWLPAFEAGRVQAAEVAEEVGAVWG
ncbi:patatin-like phospholipase family protein [Actinocorallia sp. A-T 12471]|uniref:patatin-like phospholipase family protein n=1 Tax=Actinocorallia sp. A-T 12471 TaxID=3089813 RepID=UPI0029CD3F22|nr:patatin-like phospholipase family protein [Actinocorallia sp. A-T 12471]MDX6742501.1 patatin-like phospholipase family protein [Actinocorallia sp. A-T 12471]